MIHFSKDVLHNFGAATSQESLETTGMGALHARRLSD